MAASLGTLTLDLAVRLSGYQAGLSSAERQTANSMQSMERRTQQAMNNIQNSAAGAHRALGALMATAGIGFSVSEIIKTVDAYTGIEVSNLPCNERD